jgi:hypothetical protein
MNVLQPIQELAKWLLDAGFRRSLKAIAKVPLAIADSTKLMRLVTLSGMAALSLLLLVMNVHIVRVYDAVNQTQTLAKDICLDVGARISAAIKVAQTTEWLLKTNRLTSGPETTNQLIQSLPWVQSAEISGVALISNEGYSVLYGKLDPSYDSPAWETIRWNHLRNRTATELKETTEPITVFLGIERLFRTKQYFNQGQPLTGSLAISRAWNDVNGGWQGVVILLPVQSFHSLLRLGSDQYNSGNYDYLVDESGFLLAHPNPALVYGTDASGRDIRGASNFDEVGKFPVNTRDSDWIAGTDILNQAFGAMIRHQPQTVVYKNLQRQPRLTSFRLLELENVRGKSLGVVTGRSIDVIEAVTTPMLLKRSSPLGTVLWTVAGVYLALMSAWLAFTSYFRSLHLDLLAWSRFMSPAAASKLGLLPIPKGRMADYRFSNTAAIVLSIELKNSSRKEREATVDLFARLCATLRDDGWITHVWSVRSVIACRQLTEPAEGGQTYFWSPTNVVDYLRSIKDFRAIHLPAEDSGTVSYRVVYGIGDLQIRAGRMGPEQRATISVFGSLILNVIDSNEELSAPEFSGRGVLMYPIEEAIDAGLQIVGDKVIINSKAYGSLQLGKRSQS